MPLWDGRETPEEYEERQRLREERQQEREQREREFERARSEKESILRQLESFIRSYDGRSDATEVKELSDAFYEAGYAGRDYQSDLIQRFKDLKNDFNARRQRDKEARDRQREAALRIKQDLLHRAQRAAEDTDTKAGSAALREISADWKSAPRARREDEDRLWQGLQECFERLNRRRADEMARREQESKRNRQLKEQVIERARRVAASDDWKAGKAEIAALQREFGAIGSCGRDENERLWGLFRDACDSFFKRRATATQAFMKELQQGTRAREALLDEAKSAASHPSNWNQANETLKSIHEKWKTAGPVLKDRKDAIFGEYQAVRRKFYERWDEIRAAERKQREQASGKKSGFLGPEEKRGLERGIRSSFKWAGDGNSVLGKNFDPFAATRKESKPDAERNRPGRPRLNESGSPIGHFDTKREIRDNTRRAERMWTENRRGPVEAHHSHFKVMGGPTNQPLTSMTRPAHQGLHDDASQFFRLRGVEIAGRSPQQVAESYGPGNMVRLLADFYVSNQPNGGAGTQAAKDFFAKYPSERDQAISRAEAERKYLEQYPPQEHAFRLSEWHKKK
jgi:hypothetical protein